MCKFLNSTQNFGSYPVKIFVFTNFPHFCDLHEKKLRIYKK